jgi:hypothetical protein
VLAGPYWIGHVLIRVIGFIKILLGFSSSDAHMEWTAPETEVNTSVHPLNLISSTPSPSFVKQRLKKNYGALHHPST